MSFSLFISKRYLFSKKTNNVVNIISIISLFGVAVGTMSLVIVLSVFNGFDEVIKNQFNSYDPDLKISIKQGKFFKIDSAKIKEIQSLPEVEDVCGVIEENVLVNYYGKQYVATLKGVTDNFLNINLVGNKITEGKATLWNNKAPVCIIGQGISYYLGVNIESYEPLFLYTPHKDVDLYQNPERSFNVLAINPVGIFSVEQEVDSRYIIAPIKFAKKLFFINDSLSALEVKSKTTNISVLQNKIEKIMGSSYNVKNRYQQQEFFYKIMKSEKWAIFFILTFILIIASLNIISSITMLIIEKKTDIVTLNFLGANWEKIRKIFLFNGWMNVLFGSIIGILLGLLICEIQVKFGIIKLHGTGSFIIDNYPVKIIFTDLVLIFTTVLIIGFFTSYIPVHVVSARYFKNLKNF